MSHFYDRNGAPCHYQPKKKGGGLRPTTIADARKLGLYPSVSTILAILHKEKLVQKMMEKVILEARQQAQLSIVDAKDDEFVSDVKEAAFADWGNAQDLGSRIHKAIELNMGPAGLVPEDDLAPYVLPAVAKVKELGIIKKEAECVIVSHQHGYAGTTDLTGYVGCYRTIADFKSTKTKPGKKVEGWDTQVMQLAAYHVAYWGKRSPQTPLWPEDHAYNIYISTTEPGRVEAIKRTSEELGAAFKAFLALCEVYFWMNDYDPRKNT